MLQYAAAYSHPVAASVCFACGIATGAPSYPRESLLRHHTCASVWVTTAGHCPCEETYTGPKSISTEICSVYVLFRASMGRSAGAQAAATHCDSLHCMYASCLALCPRKYLTGPAHAFMHRVLSWMSRGGFFETSVEVKHAPTAVSACDSHAACPLRYAKRAVVVCAMR